MLKTIFIALAILSLSLQANETEESIIKEPIELMGKCDAIYDNCAANCSESDSNCFSACEVSYDECLQTELIEDKDKLD